MPAAKPAANRSMPTTPSSSHTKSSARLRRVPLRHRRSLKPPFPAREPLRVGIDVTAATYTSTPATSGYNCWGTRLSGMSDTSATKIEVEYAEGPVYITIPSDVAFKSESCQTCTLVR